MPDLTQTDNEFARAIGRLEGKLDLIVHSVNALASSFENLEKGRLSRLEIGFASLNIEAKTKARNMATLISAIVSIVVMFVGTFFIKYFGL